MLVPEAERLSALTIDIRGRMSRRRTSTVESIKGITVAPLSRTPFETRGFRKASMEDRPMNRPFVMVGVLFGVVTSILAYAGASSADTTVVEPPAPAPAPAPVVATPVVAAPARETRDEYSGPNRRLIATGLLTFGLSYIPSVIVAGTSDVSADHHLYVPLAGPWLDLGDRPGCGSGQIGCDTETTYKVLLVLDGVFQGLGALTTVAGFLSPEHHVLVAADSDKPTLHVAPASVASGYGVAAFGSF
jgi:hypothetical protein